VHAVLVVSHDLAVCDAIRYSFGIDPQFGPAFVRSCPRGLNGSMTSNLVGRLSLLSFRLA
jgi:hypothetical protein